MTCRFLCVVFLLLQVVGPAAAWAQGAMATPPTFDGQLLELHGQWSRAPSSEAAATPAPGAPASQPMVRLSPTGGHYVYHAEFALDRPAAVVLDFKNSSVLAQFEHRVYDAQGALQARLRGGLASAEPNPFFLRHGRDLTLPAGRYRLETELRSPFLLAQPEPYLSGLSHYQQAIKPGNAITLICLGVFLGLGLYYGCLALVRRQRVHAMYALFILGNGLYNGAALLVAADLGAVRWIYWVSLPILLSNMAYVVFVMDLLQIRADSTPRAHRVGCAVLALMAGMAVLGVAMPSWSLELDRLGVALFLLYGLGAGVLQAMREQVLARLYLLANVGFFVSGVMAISLLDLEGVYTFYIEHLGLLAVTLEVLLLAWVLAFQFGLLQREKETALARAEGHLQLARTDLLTGLPNRLALEQALVRLPPGGSLTFVDLDGLKHTNDNYGHARGDQLLQTFSRELSVRLGAVATVHRLGGDEFAATSESGDVETIERVLAEVVSAVREQGFELWGASHGSVRVSECAHPDQLKHLADVRMYENKRRRRVRDQALGLAASLR